MSASSSKPLSFARSSTRRRLQLTELERTDDPLIWEERRCAVCALLTRPLLIDSSADRTLVARHQEWLGLWFSHHLGWELSVDADACRLIKRPADTLDGSRPCRDPSSKESALSKRGYVFLCLTLSVLVRSDRQITLKYLAENLSGIGTANPVFSENRIDLSLDERPARRDLVQALRVLLDWRVLVRVDGSEDGFVASDQADALYTVKRATLSRLLAVRQPPSLVKTSDFDQRLHAIWKGASAHDSDELENREIRFTLFRRLIDDPVLYYADLSQPEREYLEKQQHFIIREIQKATGLIGEVRSEGIAMVDRTAALSDYSLPESGTDGHLTLLLATFLANHLRGKNDAPVPFSALEAETRALAKKHKTWRKDARTPGSETHLTRAAISRLAALHLIRIDGESPDHTIVPLPAIARFGLKPHDPEPPDLLLR